MEDPAPGVVILQSIRPIRTSMVNGGFSLDQEQEQQDDSEPDTQPESNQGTPEPKSVSPQQAFIEFRIQQLHNRRFLLLKMQNLRKTTEDNSCKTTKEMSSEDSSELCELEAIQKELEELQATKEEMERQGKSSKFSQQDSSFTCYKSETPRGGIYILPPPQLTQEDNLTPGQRPEAETPTSACTLVPVDSLGERPAVTECPSCGEVVFTETRERVGEVTWMTCCLCSVIGCVGGCCLIPFFIGRLKNVEHQCPQCHAHVYTHKPF